MDVNASSHCTSPPGYDEAGDDPFYKVDQRIEGVEVEVRSETSVTPSMILTNHRRWM